MAGIVLNNPATQATFTNSGVISNYNADAVFGTALFPWTVNNKGTIEDTGTAGSGVHLLQGGAVNNLTSGSQIIGYGDGVYIEGAPGLVTNLGLIEATGTDGDAVHLSEGGKVVNGSATVTNALIEGQRHAINITGGAGTVVNFGSLATVEAHTTVLLFDGGTVTNGASASTAATITGPGTGIYFKYGGGGVTNFGHITGSTGVLLRAGGTVNNGAPGSMIATITGTSGNGVKISGTTGTVTNFGTIQSLGQSGAVVLNGDGGLVTNGSTTVTTALITGLGTGVYVGQGAGTVANFGTIVSSSQRGDPVTVEGGVVLNEGTILSLNTSNSVIYMHGGSLTNVKNGAVGGLISGAGNGVTFRGAAGTAVNAGTIQSTGNAGIYLGAGGVVTNQAGGSVFGRSVGLFVRAGGSATLTNNGAIQATAGNAVYLGDGGLVVNQTGAQIAGSATGLFIRGAVTTANNSGTISGTSGSGIYLGLGGLVINNAGGTIGGGGGNGNGIFSRGGTATITNGGTIAGTGTLGNGVYLGTGGTISNVAGGVIEGVQDGVLNLGPPIAVTNAGTITSIGTFNGVYLRAGGSIVNTLGGTISGAAAGICIAGPNPATIVNDGVISGGIGVYRYPFSGSILTLTNAGTISSTAGTAGTAVILSNADFKGLLVVDVGAVFVGAVEGGGNSEVDFLAAGVADAGNMTGFATIGLGNGVSHSLTLTDANFTGVNFNHITVVGGDSGNTVNAIGVTDPTHTMIFVGGAGNDAFTGGAGNDTFRFSAAALQATDSVDGAGGARDTLQMTSFGTINAAGVSGVEIYRLANGGSNTLVLANANASGITGGLIRIYGGNAGNTVNGAAVNLLPAVQLVMYGGAGTDHFTGGAGADTFVFTASNLGAADTVAGSGGSDELLLTTAGAIHAGGVRGVENIALAGGGANTLTLTNANFTGVIGASIRVIGGNGKNTIDASAVTGANALVFVGGPGSDVVKAGTVATITGRGGTNDFEFVAPGTHTITDFGLSATNRIDFSSAGFALGLAGTATPTALPASLIGSLTDGSFSNNIQRFSYNKGAGQVLFDADGSDNGSSAQVVATLTNDPTLTASHLFFVT